MSVWISLKSFLISGFVQYTKATCPADRAHSLDMCFVAHRFLGWVLLPIFISFFFLSIWPLCAGYCSLFGPKSPLCSFSGFCAPAFICNALPLSAHLSSFRATISSLAPYSNTSVEALNVMTFASQDLKGRLHQLRAQGNRGAVTGAINSLNDLLFKATNLKEDHVNGKATLVQSLRAMDASLMQISNLFASLEVALTHSLTVDWTNPTQNHLVALRDQTLRFMDDAEQALTEAREAMLKIREKTESYILSVQQTKDVFDVASIHISTAINNAEFHTGVDTVVDIAQEVPGDVIKGGLVGGIIGGALGCASGFFFGGPAGCWVSASAGASYAAAALSLLFGGDSVRNITIEHQYAVRDVPTLREIQSIPFTEALRKHAEEMKLVIEAITAMQMELKEVGHDVRDINDVTVQSSILSHFILGELTMRVADVRRTLNQVQKRMSTEGSGSSVPRLEDGLR